MIRYLAAVGTIAAAASVARLAVAIMDYRKPWSR
jgi:hypothetical protein